VAIVLQFLNAFSRPDTEEVPISKLRVTSSSKVPVENP